MTALSLQRVHNPFLLSLEFSILSVSYPLYFDPSPINGHHASLLLFVKGKFKISIITLNRLKM